MMGTTVVIFRVDKEGVVFALFPELPADECGHFCTAYQNIGQHCAADYYGCIANSDPACPAEYADLSEELEKRGYHLTVRRRAAPEIHERRRRIAAEWRVKSLEKQPA